MSPDTENGATGDRRDDWWHVVLATPLVLPIGGAIGGYVGGMLVLSMWVLYLPAMVFDARYVREIGDGWTPSKRFAWAAGGAVVVTLGILSVVVSPYYLYRRHGAVGTP